MLIVTLMIIWTFVKSITTTKNLLNQEINLNFVCFDVEVVDIVDTVVDRIESDIMNCYHETIFNKRERIVMLLDTLAKYIDPEDFLDKNPHIMSYIFNRSVG